MTKFVIKADEAGSRLDLVLSRKLGSSRSQAQVLLKSGNVTVNRAPAKPSSIVDEGDLVEVVTLEAESIKVVLPRLQVVYEDQDLLVIDKPAGVLVHSGAGSHEGTIADSVRQLVEDDDQDRPGIVHRLDRNTSGLLIIAKNPSSKAFLQKLFRDRKVHKTYQTLVIGHPDPETASIQLPLGRSKATRVRRSVDASGRPSTTRYRTLVSYPGYALLAAEPQTGRTHQIRAHLSAIGHPVAGDSLYGAPAGPSGLKRQFLHAWKLDFIGPHGQAVKVESPLPVDLQIPLDRLSHGV